MSSSRVKRLQRISWWQLPAQDILTRFCGWSAHNGFSSAPHDRLTLYQNQELDTSRHHLDALVQAIHWPSLHSRWLLWCLTSACHSHQWPWQFISHHKSTSDLTYVQSSNHPCCSEAEPSRDWSWWFQDCLWPYLVCPQSALTLLCQSWSHGPLGSLLGSSG